MASIDILLTELAQTENGFNHIIKAGDLLLSDSNLTHLDLAIDLLNDKRYSSRMLATYILGELSNQYSYALKILKEKISRDDNWRVQEMLAKAFDVYCAKLGYEKAISTIKDWLSDVHPNVKRAVTEGLRIWTIRPYFKQHPEVAIQLIASVKDNESEYLRKSVGNALRDIRKKYPELINSEIKNWDTSDEKLKLVMKLIEK